MRFYVINDVIGCLSETIENTLDDGGVIAPEEYTWKMTENWSSLLTTSQD